MIVGLPFWIAWLLVVSMRTVFVTGATGFIGRNLVAALLDRGDHVRCLVRSPDRARHLECAGVRIVPGSLDDVAAWGHELRGCVAVFHVGGLVSARRHGDFAAVNGHATGSLADACAALETPPTLVFFSSLAAAGPGPAGSGRRAERDPFVPVSAYGASKLLGERELRRRAGRLPITSLQPGVVFGPHDPKILALYQMIDVARLHLPVGWRRVPLSLVHVTDVVDLALAAAERGERMTPANDDASGIYHVCDDREHPTWGELGRRVACGLGRSVLVVPFPTPVVWPAVAGIEAFWNLVGQPSIVSRDKLREATARSWAASAAKARDQLAFAPAATLDERLRETGDWFRTHGLL
jgi:dihydroflavonol-4-reductase